jgi:hypothetical protein
MSDNGITRRRVLAGTGATLASGGVLFATTSGTAKAQSEVRYGQLEVPDSTHLLESGDVKDVQMVVNAEFTWSSNYNPDKWELQLKVGTNQDDVIPIAEATSDDTLLQEGEDTAKLSGSLLDAPDFSKNMFEVPNGGTKQVTVSTALIFELVRDGEVVGEAEATRDVLLTTTQESIEADVQVGGTGGVTVSEP